MIWSRFFYVKRMTSAFVLSEAWGDSPKVGTKAGVGVVSLRDLTSSFFNPRRS